MNLLRWGLTLAIFAATPAKIARASDSCEDPLLSATDNFLAYLDTLVDQRVLTAENLSFLGDEAKLASSAAASPSNWLVHRDAIRSQLSDPSIDRSQVAAWVSQTAHRLQAKNAKRNSVRDWTRSGSSAMSFVAIEEAEISVPPPFRIDGASFHVIRRERIAPFEFTSTLVTQGQWTTYMHTNPAYFKAGTAMKTCSGCDHIFDEDQPMENVTWWSAAEFANRISIANHLPPFYQFESLEWKPGTSAEMGTLTPVDGFKAWQAWEDSHDSTRLDATGYRLPFAREWYLVLVRAVATILNMRLEEISIQHLRRMAFEPLGWFEANSMGFPHSTRDEEKFVEIDGERIVGIVGNLWQRTSDIVTETNLPMGRSIKTFDNVGGDFDLRSPETYFIDPRRDPDDKFVGFRLARTLYRYRKAAP